VIDITETEGSLNVQSLQRMVRTGGIKMGKELDQLQSHEEHSLKGTFVSVMLLGGFLAVTWLGVFFLFISRG